MTSSTTTSPKEATPGSRRTALEAAQLNADNVKNKVFVITGAYSGIGVETTRALLHEGGKVVIGGRNRELLDAFVSKMKQEYSADQVDGYMIDLGDLETVKAFANYLKGKYEKIDVLINNAGVMNTPPGLTKNGFETQMGVNVIGHFLLSKLLVNKTKRQVWVSSLNHIIANKDGRIDIDYIKSFQPDDTAYYDGWKAYQQSKLGDILLAKEFDKRYPHLEAASLHPGGVNTNLVRHIGSFAMIGLMFFIVPQLIRGTVKVKSPQVGASTTVTVATLPSDQLVAGGYYDDCEIGEESDAARNEEDMKALFDYCDEVTKPFQ